MSQLKLTAESGGGTVAIKGPASTTGNAAIDLTVPGTASATLDTLNRTGNILQVLSTVKTDGFSASVGGAATSSVITGLTVTITPASTNSKILLIAHISGAVIGSTWQYWSLTRGGSKLTGATGDQWGSNRTRNTIGGFPYSSTAVSYTHLTLPTTPYV